MKKANSILNIIIGAFIGVFLGHGIYVVWNYLSHSELYAMQSAPWYTSIIVYGVFTLAIIIVGILIKFVFKLCSKRIENKETE